MTRYAAALSVHPVPVEALGEVAGELLERLDGDRPDLLVCFASPSHTGALEDLAAGLQGLLEPGVLVGCTASGIAGGRREIEDGPALSVFAACFGGTGQATAVALAATEDDEGFAITGWPDGVAARGTLLLLADPLTFPVADFLRLANDRLPELRVVGGLASAGNTVAGNRVLLGPSVFAGGAVGALLDADVPVRTIVSQGCRPIGRPFTITRAERNLVVELAGQSAVRRLQELAAELPDDERELLRRGLQVGLVVDEHRDEFRRGDFLVRNLLGAVRDTGALAIGEAVDVGQTLQFHVRDADSADDDLRFALTGTDGAAALLFTCNGRGAQLFGRPDHDASVVEELLGPIPLAGAFCSGEIGPVGGRNHVHGFTASLAVFGS